MSKPLTGSVWTFNNIPGQERVILQLPSSSLKLIKVKCLWGQKNRAARETERGEVDKACSFLLNGEGSQRKRAGGHEGKREKIKLVRREEEGEVSGSKVTNGRHSAWFCLLNSPVMEAWIRVQNCEGNRERRGEREQKGCYTFFITYPGPKPHQRV